MASPIIEAHRGASAEASENTLAAFQRAIDLNADSIELDVHPAADGTLAVIHDATLDRTTDGVGEVGSFTFNTLRKLDAGAKFHADFAGQRIPTLAEVMGRLASSPTTLNIEIKSPPPGMKVAGQVVQLLRHFDRAARDVVSSFDLEALLAVRRLAPEVTLALIGETPVILAWALEHRFPWIHCSDSSLTAELVARAHAGGLRVGVWTVDDPGRFRLWAAQGVEKIITNNPREMLALRME
jgi:glycerophosphoryl diester phosphodiesterase